MNHDSVNLGIELLEELDRGKKKKSNFCQGCSMYEQFGKKCWFYWEDKKFCSQHSDNL